MITTEFTLEGLFYDGISPVSRKARLTVSSDKVRLCYDDVERVITKNSLRVSPRTGRADRFITFSDGGQYQCPDQDVLDSLPQEFTTEGIVAWLEEHISVALASIFLVALSLFLCYFYGLPALADKVAEKLPLEIEERFGDSIFSWLDENMLGPSKIAGEQQAQIVDEFRSLHAELQSSSSLRLYFRNGNALGPNAFALPGGNIVITDKLVEIAISSDEILSILAHEAGHVEKRHAIRNILQNSMVVLAVTSVTSDVSMLGGAMASLPVVFLQSKYSRDFEEEADSFAVHLLEDHNISPQVFADILERLDARFGGMPGELAFLSSHPLTSERIKKVRNQ